MGGKKTVEKSREWEKERRHNLNHGFFELSKLLPDHDPSMVLSKKEILTQAAQYIKQLQEQNQQILKEGMDSILKVESERLRRRVAHLLLKTKLLVDALRSAGVPLPSEKKKRKPSKKQKLQNDRAPGNQNKPSDPQGSPSEPQNLAEGINVRKRVKCGCDKVKVPKIPLKEINTGVDTKGETVKNGKSSGSPDVFKSKTDEAPKSSEPVVVSVSQPIINNSIVATGGVKQLPVLERNILSSLGPGTLIMADGRVVNVPPPSIVPQILVKPSLPPPTVILLSNTKWKEKKEKLLLPKRREVTKTTFANKAPIPAVQTYRLESQPRTRTKKKPAKKAVAVVQKTPPEKSEKSADKSPEKPDKEQNSATPEAPGDLNTQNIAEEREKSDKRKCDEVVDERPTKVVIVENPPECEEPVPETFCPQEEPNTVIALEADASLPVVDKTNEFSQENNAVDSGSTEREDILKTTGPVKYTIDSLFNKGEEQNDQEEEEISSELAQNEAPVSSETAVAELPPEPPPMEDVPPLPAPQPSPEKLSEDTGDKNHVETFVSSEAPSVTTATVTQSNDILTTTQNTVDIALRSSERFVDKLYSTNTEGSSFKTDCVLSADFLRTKDIERNTFIPIIDDVRLASDFSNDLFNSLQVPTGGQHPESISPTAAFLLAFPLVSTSKNTENLAENENNENQTSTPTTILQIGNIEPPSTELFHAMEYHSQKKQDVPGKDIESYQGYELSTEYDNRMTNPEIQDKGNYNRPVPEKKKDSAAYGMNENFQNKNQRKNCDTRLGEDRHSNHSNMKNDAVTIPNSFQQSYSYPLFTSCNDFTVLPPPQYSISDPKLDHINVMPWSSNVDYLNQNPVEKEICPVQKPKQSCERKSKSDKSVQKGYSYNYGHSQYQMNECYNGKQDKKKGKHHQAKVPVNWMTAPDSRNVLLEPLPHLDIYTPQKELEPSSTFSVPSTSQNLFTNSFPSIEMSVDGFPEFCNSKNKSNNYSWSPSKSLLPSLDNHSLVIPSTLPTLVGDLALGTTTPSDSYRSYDNKKYEQKKPNPEKDERTKKRSDYSSKSQLQNPSFLSVSQLVDPKCKKQSKQPEAKQPGCTKRQSEKTTKQQRSNCNYGSNRKDEPNCMYSGDKNNFLPAFPNQWSEKQRNQNQFKGGSYSAESLIGVQQNQEPGDTFHSGFNSYQATTQNAGGYFQNTTADYNHQSAPVVHDNQQYQNCFNFAQGHFPTAFVADDYQMDGFSFPGGSQCGGKPQRRSKWREEAKGYQANTTTTLTNFNLSTIFPEMNDQRGPSSVQPPHMNSSFGNISSHNYPIHLPQ